ncbi:serine protease 30-like [Physella acuta]|uniref:serine protease 30-like n=1 Tax=Physella acuta TaxID=109671 RepID=UPI0027DE56C3|nr:serine protease 30-like [Physella acuta]
MEDAPPCGSRPIPGNDALDERSLSRASKIVGGVEAVAGSEPWQFNMMLDVSPVEDKDGVSTLHQCGGTIIDEYWLLTAAHCYTKTTKITVLNDKNEQDLKEISINVNNYYVVVGDYSLKEDEVEQERFEVEAYILHENYDASTNENDIALIKIKPNDGHGIQYSDRVQPACLPDADTDYTVGLACIISGWGNTNGTEDGVDNPTILQDAVVPILADDDCTKFYENTEDKFNKETMLCAGYREGGVDTCQGDSGGPLVCNVNGAYTVLGVTSFGEGCAQPGYPGIYTRVQSYLDWIAATIEKNSSDGGYDY